MSEQLRREAGGNRLTGDTTDWVAIVVAVAALLISGVTLWMQVVDRRRADAATVDVYFDATKGSAVVNNDGSRSIYNVVVQVKASGEEVPLEARRVFRLPPKESCVFTPTVQIVDAEAMGPELLGVRADFSDWAKRRWMRSNAGALRRARIWNRIAVKE